MNLSNRLDRLERVTAASSIFIRMQSDESAEQARARWLIEHPDRKTALEQAGERVNFVRRVIVDVAERHHDRT